MNRAKQPLSGIAKPPAKPTSTLWGGFCATRAAAATFYASVGTTMVGGTGTTTGSTTTGMFSICLPRSQLSPFLPHFGGGVFLNFPNQPPNILPISSKGSDKDMYFLSSNDPASQIIISKTFTVSIFLIANLMHGDLLSFGKNTAVLTASIASTNKSSIFTANE